MRELTPVVIDKLQKYFGIAIRANCTTVENMQMAIWAGFFHVASSKENDYHSHCEAPATSWCEFQGDKINPGSGLSIDIFRGLRCSIKKTPVLKCR